MDAVTEVLERFDVRQMRSLPGKQSGEPCGQ
jgi:hypothetical protein